MNISVNFMNCGHSLAMESIRYLICFVMKRMIHNCLHVLRQSRFVLLKSVRNLNRFVIERTIQNYEYEWRERNVRLKITYMNGGNCYICKEV